MFLKVLEFGFIAIFTLVMVTQVILPPFIGKPFFWFFRKAEKNIRKKELELMNVQTEKEIQNLDRKIEKEKEELK